MSKVVHLSDTAHRRAKEYCTPRSLKMSDWVGMLIDQATETATTEVAGESPHKEVVNLASSLVSKKRITGFEEVEPQTDEDGTPIYAAPPFWARSTTTH